MKKWMLALALAFSVVALSACGQSGSDNVAESKAGNVTKDELYNAMKQKYGDATLQQLVYEKVLAKKYKVTDAEITKRVDAIKKQAGNNFQMVLLQNNIKDEKELKDLIKSQILIEKATAKDIQVTDKELKDYYANYKPEIRARHILVNDLKTAKEVKQKLDAGQKFEDLVKKYSKDTGTVQKGGDLGWFGTGKMDPSFEKAAYALKMNQISDPVKSQFGYHIIQKTGEKKKQSFDQMKNQMEQTIKSSKLTQDVVNKALQRELKAVDVKILDKDLKDALNPTSSTAAPASQG